MGIPGIVALMAVNNLRASTVESGYSDGASGGPHDNRYGSMWREELIRSVIKRAKPSIFGWFNICPLNEVDDILNVKERNDAYRFLESLHCVGYFHISRKIRKRIPALIREALTTEEHGQ